MSQLHENNDVVAAQLVPDFSGAYARRFLRGKGFTERGGERLRTGQCPDNNSRTTNKNTWAALLRPIFLSLRPQNPQEP
jgi:hypothetical protein